MRTFEDGHGQRWQAALLHASYGNVMLVFSPLEGSDVRQLLLDAENLRQAEADLQAMGDATLRTLLDQADDWQPGGGMS